MSHVGVPVWPRWTLAAIATLEGLALVGYAGADGALAMTQGLDGPPDVASPLGVLMQIIVMIALGAGLLWIAVGWRAGRRWVRAPFVLAQLILGFILVSLAQSSGSTVRLVGMIGVGVTAVGLIVALLPVSRPDVDSAAGG